MQSVSEWQKGIQPSNTGNTGFQSVSAWRSTRPTTTRQQLQPELSFFDKLKGFGSSALSGIKQIPSYLSQSVRNPIQSGEGVFNTGVVKPLAFLNEIGVSLTKKFGIKTSEPRNVFAEASKAIDELKRSDNQQKAYDTGSFLGYMIPFSKVSQGARLGLGALKLTPKVAKFIPAIADTVGFLGTGQILYEEENGSRVDQLKNDTIALALFTGGGFLLKRGLALRQNKLKNTLSEKAKKEVTEVMKPVASTLESGGKVPSSVLDEAVTKANSVVIRDTGKTTKELLLDSLEKRAKTSVKELRTRPALKNELRVKPIKTKSAPKIKEEPLKVFSTESTSGLAKSIKRKAIKSKMIFAFDKRFNELPKLERRIKKEDIKKTDEFTVNNPNEAFVVAMGRKPAPAGMLPEDMLVSVTNYASATGNVEVMRKLANESGLLLESRILGQRVQALSQLNPVARKLTEVIKAHQGKVVNYDKRVNSTRKTIKNEVKKNNLSKEDTNWSKFLDSIVC